MERGVCESLFPEADLVSDGEQDDVTKLEIGRDVSMEVMLFVMTFLQGEESQVVLSVLRLRIDVMLEMEDEGVEGGRVEVPGGVQVHEGAVEDLQLSEDTHGSSGVHLASKHQVPDDLFRDLCSSSQVVMVCFERSGESDLLFDRELVGKRHVDGLQQASGVAASVLSVASRSLVECRHVTPRQLDVRAVVTVRSKGF